MFLPWLDSQQLVFRQSSIKEALFLITQEKAEFAAVLIFNKLPAEQPAQELIPSSDQFCRLLVHRYEKAFNWLVLTDYLLQVLSLEQLLPEERHKCIGAGAFDVWTVFHHDRSIAGPFKRTS